MKPNLNAYAYASVTKKKKNKSPEKEERAPFKGHKTKKHFLNEIKEREDEKELRDSIRRLPIVHPQE